MDNNLPIQSENANINALTGYPQGLPPNDFVCRGQRAMKSTLVVACILSVGAFSLESRAQSCKPDVSKQDRISKEQTDIWSQVLFKTSFGSSLINTSEVGITGAVGRYGTENAVKILDSLKKSAPFDSVLFVVAIGTDTYRHWGENISRILQKTNPCIPAPPSKY